MKPPKERKIKFAVSPVYRESWSKYRHLKDALTVFNEAKRKIPPERLPDKMKDHVLIGPLKGIRECHLDDDVLLLYTHKDDLVHLLLVCGHSDIKGTKAKVIAKLIRSALKRK